MNHDTVRHPGRGRTPSAPSTATISSQFEAHLAGGCDRCRTTLRESHEALARVAQAEPRAIPPAEVKDALLRRVNGTARAARAERRSWVPWAAATAAAMVVRAMLTGGFVASRYEAQLGEMARETARRATRAAARRRPALRDAGGGCYRPAPSSCCAIRPRGWSSCAGPRPSPEATRRRSGTTRPAASSFGRRKLPRRRRPGKAYELWTLGGAGRRPAGGRVPRSDAIRAAPTASSWSRARACGQVRRHAASRRPGCRAQPTGPIVLASPLAPRADGPRSQRARRNGAWLARPRRRAARASAR